MPAFTGICPYIRFAEIRNLINNYEGWVATKDFRLFFIYRGSCSIETKQGIFSMEENSIILIPSGTPYRILLEESACLEIGILNFDLDRSATQYECESPVFLEQFDTSLIFSKTQIAAFSKIIYFSFFSEANPMIQHIEKELSRAQPFAQEIASALLQQLLFLLLRKEKQGEEEYSPLVKQILDYIQVHYAENITNDSIAQAMNYHSFYLNRCFSREVGVTIHKYLNLVRVRQAKRMLLSTEDSVEKIAIQVGFISGTYFSHYLKKLCGISPSQYRKENTRI